MSVKDTTKTSVTAPSAALGPIGITKVELGEYAVGFRWSAQDTDYICKLVALVVMGQEQHAALILRELRPAVPALSQAELIAAATVSLTVQETKETPRRGYPRWQRDGLIFEVISWIAAKTTATALSYVRAPHIRSTSQGLDGLMIELTPQKDKILLATIFEDKCSDDPRNTFTQKVIPAFQDLHSNGQRSPELVAAAALLIGHSGLEEENITKVAGQVLNRKLRAYRAALAVEPSWDTDEKRLGLFKDFETINDINPEQRIGASFVVSAGLRESFDLIAATAIEHLQSWAES